MSLGICVDGRVERKQKRWSRYCKPSSKISVCHCGNEPSIRSTGINRNSAAMRRSGPYSLNILLKLNCSAERAELLKLNEVNQEVLI